MMSQKRNIYLVRVVKQAYAYVEVKAYNQEHAKEKALLEIKNKEIEWKFREVFAQDSGRKL